MQKIKKDLDYKKLLVEIDHLFEETKAKLNSLHLKKMELIKYYRDLENKQALAKIREKINKS